VEPRPVLLTKEALTLALSGEKLPPVIGVRVTIEMQLYLAFPVLLLSMVERCKVLSDFARFLRSLSGQRG
jgi:hypothetical protein